jgi:hypothetical protein
VGIPVDQVPRQKYTYGDCERKRKGELQQITPNVLAFQKSRQKIKVIQVGDKPRKRKLHGYEDDYMIPVCLFPKTLPVIDLVEQE